MIKMFKNLAQDLRFIQTNDPAPISKLGIVLTYPGFQAVLMHRISHKLYRARLVLVAKLISYLVRVVTGIEIHPAAKIGRCFFIDHGMGVVIGETAVIGDYVYIYHGVTIGARTAKRGVKRHPTIESHVTIGAMSLILGDITIGAHSKIGAGSIVLDNIPPGSVVVGTKSKVRLPQQPQADIEYYI